MVRRGNIHGWLQDGMGVGAETLIIYNADDCQITTAIPLRNNFNVINIPSIVAGDLLSNYRSRVQSRKMIFDSKLTWDNQICYT